MHGDAAAIGPDSRQIEKWKKQIKAAGQTSIGFGWLQLIVVCGLFLVRFFVDLSKFPIVFSLPLLLISVSFGFIWILYGRRLKNVEDVNNRKNIKILLWSLLALPIAIIASGGIPGSFLLIILVVNYIQAFNAIKKLEALDHFKTEQKNIEYKFTDKHLIYFIAGSIVIISVSSYWNAAFFKVAENSAYSGSASFTDWRPYDLNPGAFRVILPAEPAQQTAGYKGTGTIFYSEKNKNEVYFVLYAESPDEDVDPNLKIENVVNAMAEGGRLISSDVTTFHEWPARNFTFENEELNFRGRAFLIGNKMFALYIVYNTGYWNESDFNAFIDSFQLQ